MKKLLKNKYIKLFIPLVVYSMFSYVILRPIFSSKGIITGGDWAFPYTLQQLGNFYTDRIYSWGKIELVGGYRAFLVDYPFALFMKVLGYLPLVVPFIPKLVLWFLYTFASFSMYMFFRYLRFSNFSSLVGGFIYVVSPFFFNYTVMGWIYVLLSMGLFPLFLVLFDKSIKEQKAYLTVAAALLFSIAFMQSTSLIWYFVGMGAIGIRYLFNSRKLKFFFLHSVIVGVILVLTHAYWVYNLFAFKDPTIFGSSNVLSSVSLGTWTHLSLTNLIRGWGSLFNYSYEIGYSKDLQLASYALTLFAGLGLFFSKKLGGYKLSLLVVFLFPIFMYALGPERIALLPLANVIRDVARMSVLVSFSLTVFSIGFFEYLFKEKKYLLLILASFALLLGANPYWTGQLYSKSTHLKDIRLRTYEYPNEYIEIETYLDKTASFEKVFYVPTTPSFSDFSNDSYRGAYREMSYVFGSMSPRQGLIFTSDKEKEGINGYYGNLVDQLKYNYENSIEYILKTLNIRYVVFYYDSMLPGDWKLLANVSSSEAFTDITSDILGQESKLVSVYEVKSPSTEVVVTDPVIVNIPAKESIRIRSAIFPLESDVHLFAPIRGEAFSNASVFAPGVSKSYEYSLDEINKGWAWPIVDNKPYTFGYKAIRLLENAKLKFSVDDKSRLELLLWFASKRAAELQTFPDVNKEPLVEDFNSKYEEILTIVSSIDNTQKDSWYFGYISKLNFYLGEANKIIPVGGLLTQVNTLLEEATYSYHGNKSFPCSGTCFVLSQEISDQSAIHLYRNKVINNPKITRDTGNIIEIEPIKETVIDNRAFMQAEPVFNSESAKALLTSHWKAFEEVLSTSIFKHIFFSLSNAHLVEIEDWEPDQDYEITFNYLPGEIPITVFVVEEVEDISLDYEQGLKQGNIVITPRVNTIKTAGNSTEAELGKEFSRTIKVESNPLAKKAYMYVLDGNAGTDKANERSITYLELRKVTSPDLLYVDPKVVISDKLPKIEFEEVNQTKYKVSVSDSQGPFGIVLKQRFNVGWKVFIDSSNEPLDEINHFVADGYANGWLVDSENKNFVLTIEFVPQKATNIGFVVAGITFALSLLVVLVGIVKKEDSLTKVSKDSQGEDLPEKLEVLKHLYREHGIDSVKLFVTRGFTYLYYILFKRDEFELNGKKHKYFYHWYNVTFRNERCVELPLAKEMVEKFSGKEILEVGNVLSHYFKVDYDILDKYEESDITIKEDIIDYRPNKKYDLVLSISTLEHVGWDEAKREKDKFLKAINHIIENLLNPEGSLLITMPMGWSDFVDDFAKRGKYGDYRVSYMKRISDDNRWIQVPRRVVKTLVYGDPFPNANGLIIIEK